ncbi:hypothetical protein ARMGADRAFT_88060 [Armillaria gallica]|uniref:Uncharacterized protein n=1 Tax=Armillaria gallica TaxID=47427 RepID=A0A2H3DYK7_ARMGA|nr:hypothetical protein ARMGADRAFT_88060 [Armillaria gallica]
MYGFTWIAHKIYLHVTTLTPVFSTLIIFLFRWGQKRVALTRARRECKAVRWVCWNGRRASETQKARCICTGCLSLSHPV